MLLCYCFPDFHNQLISVSMQHKGLGCFTDNRATGKTYYSRHLLRKMVTSKNRIYMPPTMLENSPCGTGASWRFLTGLWKMVAEVWKLGVLLLKTLNRCRKATGRSSHTMRNPTLLNMMTACLMTCQLQIICTFNVELTDVRHALLRPGRLNCPKRFKVTQWVICATSCQRLGIKHHFRKPATLGEFIAPCEKKQNTLIHDLDPEREALALFMTMYQAIRQGFNDNMLLQNSGWVILHVSLLLIPRISTNRQALGYPAEH